MLDTTIITGKIFTGQPSASNLISKRLYVKVFPGEFWHRPPRAKKAKVYGGEIFVRYSAREWPEKKNGPLLGDQGLLQSLGDLLRSVNLVNIEELSYAKVQHDLKEVLTISVGPNLAKEIIDRGWAKINQDPEMAVSKALFKAKTEKLEETSTVTTIGEALMLPVETVEDANQQEIVQESVAGPVQKTKSVPAKKIPTKDSSTQKTEPKKKNPPQKKSPIEESITEQAMDEPKKKQPPVKKKQ
jgi:hypothetical protein